MTSSLPMFLQITDPEIIAFYVEHNLDFQKLNRHFFVLLKETLVESDDNRDLLRLQVTTIIPQLTKQLSCIQETIEHKLDESNTTTLENVKQLLKYNTDDMVFPMFKDTMQSTLDKMTMLLEEVVAKSSNGVTTHFSEKLQELNNAVSHEMSQLKHSSEEAQKMVLKESVQSVLGKTEELLEDIIPSINNNLSSSLLMEYKMMHSTVMMELGKMSTLCGTTSQESKYIDKLLDTVEKQITSSVGKIVQQLHAADTNHGQLMKVFTDFTNKFDRSSSTKKGFVSEQMTYQILVGAFPSAQVCHVGDQKQTGDIVFQRNNKPKILIENKDHECGNVPKADVDKFMRDCEIQNCSGIMFAQHRGIANKENFEMQIHRGNVLLYLHNVGFDSEKIKIAVEIVESLKMRLDEVCQLADNSKNDASENFSVNKQQMTQISAEWSAFMTQKAALLKTLKEFQEKMNILIRDLQMPSVEMLLELLTHQSNIVCTTKSKDVAVAKDAEKETKKRKATKNENNDPFATSFGLQQFFTPSKK